VSLILSILAALAGSECADRLARPRGLRAAQPLAGLAWRIAIPVLLWLSVTAATGRPFFAAAVSVATAATLAVISRLKQRHLREPLVFSDLAFVAHVARHPHLFYLRKSHVAALIGGSLLVGIAIAGWLALEPPGIGAAGRMIAAAFALGLAAVLALKPDFLIRAARRVVTRPALEADVARIGLLATLLIYWLLWRAQPLPAVRESRADPVRASSDRYANVIVVQAESFIDPRRLGYADIALPAFDRMKERALSHGLLEVPCEGAYTLRPESAFISGLGFRDQGFDAYHPYLRPGRIAPGALPRMLSAQGWWTVFVHPHDIRFFRRDRAMPQFGFTTVIDESALGAPDRHGPYISDAAVARVIMQEARAARDAAQPMFLFAVTMEAHDPYGPGRLPGEDHPVRQYFQHLRNADRMLAALVDAFDDEESRTLLVFYGDHVPFLPQLADPFPDSRTDYVIVELGRNASRSDANASISACEHIHEFLRGRLSGDCASPSLESQSTA
jgi:phosphoglycerol transferase MdoB-like AlkP superfamily enzyme